MDPRFCILTKMIMNIGARYPDRSGAVIWNGSYQALDIRRRGAQT